MIPRREGFVAVFVFMMIAFMTLLVTSLLNYTLSSGARGMVALKQKRAQMLALSGVQYAIARLGREQDEEAGGEKKVDTEAKSGTTAGESEAVKKKPAANKPWANALFEQNKWLTLELKDERDGIDGIVRVYIAGEGGKINLNGLYDFKKKQYSASGKNLVPYLDERLKAYLRGVSFKELFDRATQSRTRPFSDVTELMAGFVGPAAADLSMLTWLGEGRDFAFTDLFTTDPACPKLEPIFLSHSLGLLLGLKEQAHKGEAEEGAAEHKRPKKSELVSLFSAQPIEWKTAWDKGVAPFVGKGYTEIPQSIRELFAQQISGTTFSVTSIGQYDGVTQAIVARVVYLEEQEKGKSTRFFYVTQAVWL